MAYLALSPVSAALYEALNVPSLTALAPGGVHDDVPQAPTYPFVLFTVGESQQFGGFGTKPGAGMLPEIAIRVHVISAYRGFQEAQAVLAKIRELLADAPAVSGYGSWALFWDDVLPVPDELVGGVKVKELVANARLYVEEA